MDRMNLGRLRTRSDVDGWDADVGKTLANGWEALDAAGTREKLDCDRLHCGMLQRMRSRRCAGGETDPGASRMRRKKRDEVGIWDCEI